jgi:hypothetical protein
MFFRLSIPTRQSTDTQKTLPYLGVFLCVVPPQGLGFVGMRPHKDCLGILKISNLTLSVWVYIFVNDTNETPKRGFGTVSFTTEYLHL